MLSKRLLALAVLVVALVGLATGLFSPSVRAVSPTSGHWVIASLNRHLGHGGLSGVSGVAANDIWAVGSLRSSPLVEHWNGIRWRVVPISGIAPQSAGIRWRQLGAVASAAPHEIWAVGEGGHQCSVLPVIEKWNGRRWTLVASPLAPGPGIGVLYSISAASRSDIWAVGSFSPHANVCAEGRIHGRIYPTRPLVLHWNGRKWLQVPIAAIGSGSRFWSVASLSQKDVWAVGYESTPHNGNRTLIEHWNGHQWRVAGGPHPGPLGRGFLMGIAATGPRDVWAVGYYASSGRRQRTLVERWNGSKWQQVASPNLSCHLNNFSSVAILNQNDGWVVGSAEYCSHPAEKTIAAHWNGSRWVLVPSQDTAGYETFLAGIAAPTAGSVWAVGASDSQSNGRGYSVIERYRGR